MLKAVFIDRDGVINKYLDNDYVKSWHDFAFLPKAREAMKLLANAGWEVIVITNQAGIGKGVMTKKTVEAINARMTAEIEAHGGRIKATYYCPHRSDENCECRKPRPGMLLRAAREHKIDLTDCYLIGDAITDIQAGKAVGCRTVLVRTGRGEGQLKNRDEWPVLPDYIATDIHEGARSILNVDEEK